MGQLQPRRGDGQRQRRDQGDQGRQSHHHRHNGEVQGSAAIRVKAPLLPPKVEQIHPYLVTPASNSLYRMPVVILRYLPTADGVTLDSSVSPDYWELGHITLKDVKRRLDTFDFRVKFMLEEGSRFRGYQNPNALPALGYRVVAAITVYEPLPPGPVGVPSKGSPSIARTIIRSSSDSTRGTTWRTWE